MGKVGWNKWTPRRSGAPDTAGSGGAFRLLLAANRLPTWVYDLETLRVVEVNAAAVAHYGYSRDELLHMSIADIRPEGDNLRLHRSIAERKDVLQHAGTWRHRARTGRSSRSRSPRTCSAGRGARPRSWSSMT